MTPGSDPGSASDLLPSSPKIQALSRGGLSVVAASLFMDMLNAQLANISKIVKLVKNLYYRPMSRAKLLKES